MVAVAVLMAACGGSDEPASPAELHAVGVCEAAPMYQCEAPCSGRPEADLDAQIATNPTLAECAVNNPQRGMVTSCIWHEWEGHQGCCYWSDEAAVTQFVPCL